MRQNCTQAAFRVDRIGSHYFTVGGRSSIRRLAYQRRAARTGFLRPGIVWLGGIKSHMNGVKASLLDRYAAKTGRAFLRFDYSGHGRLMAFLKPARLASGSKRALPPFVN
jgi:hypothetical protein